MMLRRWRQQLLLLSLVWMVLVVLLLPQRGVDGQRRRVAVIGEGISGSFTAKYLADYDVDCQLDSITIFEAVPMEGPIHSTSFFDNNNNNNNKNVIHDNEWQGSRVASVQLDNGINIELGASIGHINFHLVLDMIRNDPTIDVGAPFHTGRPDDEPEGRSMGIYNGFGGGGGDAGDGGGIGNGDDGIWLFRSFTSTTWRWLNKFLLLFRYNIDLIKMSRLVQQFIASFALLPELLDSTDAGTFFESPDEIWDRLGILPAIQVPFSTLLDQAHITDDIPWWRRWLLPYQGSLRKELLTAINLVNYNQNMDQVNGLVGMGSFAAATGSLFSITGGNHAIIRSATRQAKNVRSSRGCLGQVQQLPKRITHVIGTLQGLELVAEGGGDNNNNNMGVFDAVVLAAPLHQCRIEFVVKSQFDPAVLQPMPLGGLIRHTSAVDDNKSDNHEGHSAHPAFFPDVAKRPYTQVVTTIVSGATLQRAALVGGEDSTSSSSSSSSSLPRSILFTEAGKAVLHNITAITRIHSGSGVYKVFSNNVLPETVKTMLFGNASRTEYVKGRFLRTGRRIKHCDLFHFCLFGQNN